MRTIGLPARCTYPSPSGRQSRPPRCPRLTPRSDRAPLGVATPTSFLGRVPHAATFLAL